MKLCRFELHEDPGTPRSGIYHDGRFYETDGERAIGIHDAGAVRMLPPVGTPPAVRLFNRARDASGQPFLTYSYGNAARLQATNTEIDASGTDETLDFEVRVAVLVQSTARNVDPFESARLVLGIGLLVVFFDPEEAERLVSLGTDPTPAYDLGTLFGPVLATPDELMENRIGPDPLEFRFTVRSEVNGDLIDERTLDCPSFGTLLTIASARSPVAEGEILASPAFERRSLASSPLARSLVATDRVSVSVEPLGTLVGRII